MMKGRYVEGKINFIGTEPYTSELIRKVDEEYATVGTGATRAQSVPVILEDVNTKRQIEVFGPATILTPYDNLKTTVEAVVPHMGFVHDQLEKKTIPGISSRAVNLTGGDKPEHAIVLRENMNISDINNDNTLYYNPATGGSKTGKQIWADYNVKVMTGKVTETSK